jgi:hypothetical protein
MRPPLRVLARTPSSSISGGTEMRVSSVGEQKAHWRPQPRFISTMP